MLEEKTDELNEQEEEEINSLTAFDPDEEEDNPLSPERNLLAAILTISIKDYLRSLRGKQVHRIKAKRYWNKVRAEKWFFNPQTQDPNGFSFQFVCEQLEIDPKSIIHFINKSDPQVAHK
jgi:hypothetical protein